jgi:hypothetical protein
MRALGSKLSIAAALLLVAASGQAHHSAAMFDHTRTIQLAGTVKEFQWTNPHVWLQLTVNSTDGAEEWSVEGGGPNQLARQGWRPATFRPGDAVVVIVNPMLDGAKGGLFVGAKLADGKSLGRVE